MQVPYLRIPLVLQFFGDEARLHLLDDASLQANRSHPIPPHSQHPPAFQSSRC